MLVNNEPTPFLQQINSINEPKICQNEYYSELQTKGQTWDILLKFEQYYNDGWDGKVSVYCRNLCRDQLFHFDNENF
uniref:Uncharacterized protein n=1 Tax=Onchocerca volvulus TaxID=6282 RepID=A0A8R1TVX5_ONCVO